MNAHHHISIEYDGLHDQWRADLGDVCHTTVVCKTLSDLERVLDELEAQGRLTHEGKEEDIYWSTIRKASSK